MSCNLNKTFPVFTYVNGCIYDGPRFYDSHNLPKRHSIAFPIHYHTQNIQLYTHAIADAVDLANLKAKITLGRSQFNLMVLGV